MLRRALILLLLTWLGCWPIWCMPGWDGTEGRRVQIALEMLQRGDWMVPTLGGQPTWAKPPLHYWLLATCARWFGEGQIALRLPAVLSVFGAAWAAMELLRRWFGSRAGWMAALGIVASPLVLAEWPKAEIDPLFASLTAMSIWCLATGVAREHRMLVVGSGLLGGLALLQKGPPYFVFAFGAYLVWWRRRGFGLLLLHLVPMLLVALAYFGPLLLWRIAPAELLAVANEESIGRLALFGWENVRTIPEFWLRAILVQAPFVFWCFWEWRGARNARMDAGDLTLRMCSGAAVTAIALLTLFPGRPTRYLLPNVLLFTFAVAPAVAHFAEQRGRLPLFARRVLGLVGVAGAAALIVVPFVPRAGVAGLGLALAAALAPLAVRTPRHVVVCCLALPLVAAWTIVLERSLGWPNGPRDRVQGATL
ncbi:MAG: glycosyltransferase family 39 protein, partial [Planctomycetota bacterium]